MLAAAHDGASNVQSGASYCYSHSCCDAHPVVIIVIGPGITQCLTGRGTPGQAETSRTLLYRVMNTRDSLSLFLNGHVIFFDLLHGLFYFLYFYNNTY